MKTTSAFFARFTSYAALIFTVVNNASAQKLPNVQKVSMRAPANIKIDGKATEWGNKFQASNNATEILYTIANDDDNLYLTVQAKHHDIIDKILRGGITLNINHTLKKKDEQQVSVTYPSLEDEGSRKLLNMLTRKTYAKANEGAPPVSVDDLNKGLDAASKIIIIAGIEAISDNSISVYNQNGIKAVSHFDNDLAYTYELAIPLKYLSLPNSAANAFSYQIKVNKPTEKPFSGTGQMAPPMMITAMAPTDFWGEYTLVKK